MTGISKLWSWFKQKLNIQKKYIAFFTMMPLLFLTAIIRVPCPICDGTGEIATSGMGQVTITRVDSTLKSVGVVQGCLNYISYTYSVALNLKNKSADIEAIGFVRLGLIDYKTSKLIGSNYVPVDVPANMEIQTTFTTSFTVGIDAPTTTNVVAEIILQNAPCYVCKGTGKVALNNVPMLNAMKGTFAKEQSVSVIPSLPVPVMVEVPPEDWIGQEGSTDTWYLEHPDYTES